MASIGQFRNAVLCEDVREEVGHKKSLMGVFSGDVLVAEFPARIRVAFYFEYIPVEGAGKQVVEFILRAGDEEIGRATTNVEDDSKPRSIILPQGILQFENSADILVQAKVGESTTEILRKKVLLGEVKGVL